MPRTAFFALLQGGLWEQEVWLAPFGEVDFRALYRLAEEQAVVGLVAAGLERVSDMKVPKEDLLRFAGRALQLEQQNREMNAFVAELLGQLRDVGIACVLVKGQGVAQCYEKPLWRSSGDVDFLFSKDNYEKAKVFLLLLSSGNKPEERYSQHLGMSIGQWYVEIHGSLRTGLSAKVDKVVDEVQRDVFYGGSVRSWMNGKTTVFLPSPDNDVFFVFSHFIKHFYKEGMNLRQVCDWCRLMWTYKDTLKHDLLESRIRRAGLISEWKAFAALAVVYLGMPVDAMPLYDDARSWSKKASKLVGFILNGYTGSAVRDTFGIAQLFPWKTICYLPSIFLNVNSLKIGERLLNN